MKRFARLCQELESTSHDEHKLAALADYFTAAPAGDAAWALHFLLARKVPRAVKASQLRDWARQAAQLPEWLAKECFDAVGDTAEAAALMVPDGHSEQEQTTGDVDGMTRSHAEQQGLSLRQAVEEKVLILARQGEEAAMKTVTALWADCSPAERWVWNKLITGGMRIDVSPALIAHALAAIAGKPQHEILHRLTADWSPASNTMEQILHGWHIARAGHTASARPFPFHQPRPLSLLLESDRPAAHEDDNDQPEQAPLLFNRAHHLQSVLGNASDWTCEYQWDGVRIQAIKQQGQATLWTSDGLNITASFPELTRLVGLLPDGTVIDGDIVAWNRKNIPDYNKLHMRMSIKDKEPTLWEETPVTLVAADLLQWQGSDTRQWPVEKRRAQIKTLVQSLEGDSAIILPACLPLGSWESLFAEQPGLAGKGARGLILKQAGSIYQENSPGSDWWVLNAEPLTINSVLIAAQPGQRSKATLLNRCTLAVWDGHELVPIAKTDADLPESQLREIDAFVRANTLRKFGPVRTVPAQLVFELAFDGVLESDRHRSRILIRSPRINRWLKDKTREDATSLSALKKLI